MTDRRLSLGRRAERICRRRLRLSGWRVIDSNWKTSFGEVDLIAIDRRILVFVEVKSAGSGRPSKPGPERPVLAVGPEKQRRLVRLAEAWFAAAESRGDLPRNLEGIRFDVIGVSFTPGGRIACWEHLRDAFRASPD